MTFANDLTGATESRLILRSLEWKPVPTHPNSEIYFGSTLVVSCGDRMVGDSGRTLLIFPGQAFAMFGDPPTGFVKMRFGSESKEISADYPAFVYHDVFVYESEGLANEWVMLMGSEPHWAFPSTLFAKLLASDSLTLKYNTNTGWVTSHFDVRGLSGGLQRLSACSWPH